MSVIVIGHRNPDTDSICSAIAYAYLKRQATNEAYIAGRCGKVKAETKYVLDYFQVDEPRYFEDVKARVTDMLGQESPFAVLASAPIRDVGILAAKENTKSLPVVDTENHLVGMITLGDIAERYLNLEEFKDFDKMGITLGALVHTMGGCFLSPTDEERPLKGKAVIGGMNPNSMVKHIEPGDFVIIGDREEAQLAAIKSGAGCLIITGGFSVTEKVKEAALEASVPVLSVPHDTYSAARLLGMCAPVRTIMHQDNIITFQEDDYVDDVRKVMLDTRYRSYPVVDKDKRLVGVVSRYHLLTLQRKQVILVDHNEKSQAVLGLEQAQILEVIDHHRMGDVQTGEPIFFRGEPVGCTSTIIASMYDEQDVEIPKDMAGIMLAAILSDTVLFKSPTCTKRDKVIAEKLAKIAGVDLMEFGRAMFAAGSSLEGRSPEEIIFQDFKEFHLGEKQLGICQVETMDMEGAQKRKGSLLDAMESIRVDKKLDMVLLMLTDIINEGTLLLVAGQDLETIEKAFKVTVEAQEAYLPGVLSRKKQVIPPLSSVLGA
ncbi:putative manganese-dependent inorganic diphosphatase [Heliorestis convoluta]|uniref:inorganic diphosphatase n=1 Tax=Heliorestis convoluta TaxID=356322 RepID=A0A5Q2MXB0_9FIRM|nr:putative manganese-dependent inorganic diphosphatase [Heliorestis convoluta]QGG47137.1 Manganese-dependent inorganic pyrophosphatase [Heliorestis convoluta]